MSESLCHIELVKRVLNYVKTVVDPSFHDLIEVDNSVSSKPSRIVGNYIPDVYFFYDKRLILGEAKTLDDFDRRHSQEQFAAYLKECSSYVEHGMFVIAVPWTLVNTAKNLFRRKKKEMSSLMKIIVLDDIGGIFVL